MASTRIVIGIVVTAASSLVALAACSGSTTGTSTGDGGASSSGSGTSGSNASGGSGIKQCPTSTTSTCTDAENQAYGSCLQDKCNSEYSKCFGADYKSGKFSGSCGPYITCTQACPCNDTACTSKCAAPTSECTTCLQGFSSCSQQCPVPACATGGSSGSSGSSGTPAGTTCGTATCATGEYCSLSYDSSTSAWKDGSCKKVPSACTDKGVSDLCTCMKENSGCPTSGLIVTRCSQSNDALKFGCQ